MFGGITIDQLSANRDALRAAWMERVAEFKQAGLGPLRANATGPILSKNGELWMIVRVDGEREYDLRITVDGTITEERF